MLTISITAHSESISAIFKDWQIKALACIPNGDCDPIGSLAVWETVNRNGTKVSRASIINFLEALRKWDLITGILTTGKGGKRFDYTFEDDRDTFNEQIASLILGTLRQEYPDMDLVRIARYVIIEAA